MDTWVSDTTTSVWHELLEIYNRHHDYKISRTWHTAAATDTVGEVVLLMAAQTRF